MSGRTGPQRPSAQATRWWWIRHAPVFNPEIRIYGQRDLPADTSDEAANAAVAAMLAGITVGLWGYYFIGFYVAALLSCAASLVTILVFSWLGSSDFRFEQLSPEHRS